MYLILIDLGLNFLTQFLQSAKGMKLPLDIIAAIQATIDALVNHKQDIISKSNLDAQRG